jgi:hypothetical protein
VSVVIALQSAIRTPIHPFLVTAFCCKPAKNEKTSKTRRDCFVRRVDFRPWVWDVNSPMLGTRTHVS